MYFCDVFFVLVGDGDVAWRVSDAAAFSLILLSSACYTHTTTCGVSWWVMEMVFYEEILPSPTLIVNLPLPLLSSAKRLAVWRG